MSALIWKKGVIYFILPNVSCIKINSSVCQGVLWAGGSMGAEDLEAEGGSPWGWQIRVSPAGTHPTTPGRE